MTGSGGNAGASQELPLPLGLLLASMMANSGGFQPPGLNGPPSGNHLVLLSVPGRGLVGATIAPDSQGQERGGLIPLSALQGMSAMFPPGAEGDGDGSGPPESLGGAIQSMLEQMARVIAERSMEENSPTVPPANESVRDALPRVVVTKDDLLDSTNSRCSVCLEDYRPGCRATRMLCGHLFCTSCIREWLRGANSCPVCRYELATDQVEFESGRKQRMSGRVARLRAGELRMLRVPELRKLMRALGVSMEGCVEKVDLVTKIAAAPDVEVAPEEQCFADDYRLSYEVGELETLELPLLVNLMERHRVHHNADRSDLTEEEERKAALKSLADSGWMQDASKTASKSSTVGITGAASEKPSQGIPSSPSAEMSSTRLGSDTPSSNEELADEKRNSDSASSASPRNSAAKNPAASSSRRSGSKTETEVPKNPTPTRPSAPAPAVRRPRAGARAPNRAAASTSTPETADL